MVDKWKNHNDIVKKFFETGKVSIKDEWLDVLHNGKPMIIEDISIYKDTNPSEYERYKNLDIESVLAYPFWQNSSGFLIVLNPRKNKDKVSFIQTLVYVMHSTLTFAKFMSGRKENFTIHEIKNKKDIVINLFGTLEIHTFNGVFDEDFISSPNVVRILTFLVLHPTQNYPARRLCDEIWPNELISNPSNKIKTTIYRLHSAFNEILDDKLIICTNKGYQLNPELNITTDLQLFDDYWLLSQRALSSKAKIESLKKIIEIYRGSLLSFATGEMWLRSSEDDNDIGYFHQKMFQSMEI